MCIGLSIIEIIPERPKMVVEQVEATLTSFQYQSGMKTEL